MRDMDERSPRYSVPVAVALLVSTGAATAAGQSPSPPPLTAPGAGPASGRGGPGLSPSRASPSVAGSGDRGGGNLPPALPPSISALPATPAGGTGLGEVGGDAAPPGPNPLAYGMTLKPAPLEPGDRRFPINLAAALRLADARPLVVAAAQAGVWVAEAELTRAKILWIPTLNLGFDYIRHDGGGPDFNKGILTSPSVNFFYGGAGLTGNLPTVDAIFDPLAARQILNARHWDVQSAKNDALLRTAGAYFDVHKYRGTYAGALYAVGRGRDLLRRIDRLSEELVPRVEVDRARNFLADLEQRAASARQEWRVRSADLTQVLRLDPRAVVEPLEHDHTQITLIDPGKTLDELMPVALTNRPELASKQALIQAAVAAIRREKARPFVPNILINGFQTPNEMLQAGIFGLGPNSSLNQWVGRVDLSYQPLWQLDALGIGNLARIKQQRGLESMAIIEFYRYQDMVAADVTRASARLQSSAVRVLQADRSLRTGIITFNGNLEGLQQTTRFGDVLVLVTRPQEAVFALQLLYTAFEEYFGTVAEYNRAQFELFHALGYPARELADLRPPGQALPVDTARPGYLPPVGNGPPPATR